MERIYLTGLLEEELAEMLQDFFKQESYRARQIFDWVYKKGAEDFSLMVNLPQGLRAGLSKRFSVSSMALAEKKLSEEDGAGKYLFRLNDDEFIEAVSIPTNASCHKFLQETLGIVPSDPNYQEPKSRGTKKRLTVCISTQVGCKFGCRFCASSKGGFVRNLRSDEIVEQVLKIKKDIPDKKITNIVLMGIGEPLDNYENSLKAIRILNQRSTLNIGARRFTISTCGIIPGIERLSKEGLQVELAVSLHSPEDKVRSRLMPINKRFSLNQLIDTCRRFISKTKRQVTFEYIMIEGMNDRKVDIEKLGKLLKGMNCMLNLIPLNPIPEFKLKPPSMDKISDFCNALNRQGIKATIRQSKGRDIDASCGQLRLGYRDKG